MLDEGPIVADPSARPCILPCMRSAHWQTAGEELDVARWPPDVDHPYFPEGSRDKRLLRCPDPPPQPWLVAGHRYLFKESRPVYPDQFWAEIVASRLGRLTGVPVPPAYAAWDSASGDCAALIEWFWGYPGGPPQGFVSGGLFMKALIKDFDYQRGTQHNFSHIQLLCRAFSRARGTSTSSPLLDGDWLLDWARMLTFDALIGNTDRHQENWGFVYTRTEAGAPRAFALSPAFDNGTSLGHERPANQFERFAQAAYRQRYIDKGRHHLRWQLHDAERCGHLELLQKLLQQAPQCRQTMLSVLRFDPPELERAIMPLCDLALAVPLDAGRARFMMSLLAARQQHLLDALRP